MEEEKRIEDYAQDLCEKDNIVSDWLINRIDDLTASEKEKREERKENIKGAIMGIPLSSGIVAGLTTALTAVGMALGGDSSLAEIGQFSASVLGVSFGLCVAGEGMLATVALVSQKLGNKVAEKLFEKMGKLDDIKAIKKEKDAMNAEFEQEMEGRTL